MIIACVGKTHFEKLLESEKTIKKIFKKSYYLSMVVDFVFLCIFVTYQLLRVIASGCDAPVSLGKFLEVWTGFSFCVFIKKTGSAYLFWMPSFWVHYCIFVIMFHCWPDMPL